MRRPLMSLAAAFTLVAATASPALALGGPPWLSIEFPANPMNKSAQGAYLLVHTFHHDQAGSFTVEARAEGLVNGERKTLKLTLERTNRDGVYALNQTWPQTGDWVIVIVGAPGDGSVTALVSIADGRIRGIRVPTRKVESGRWTVPVQVTQADIESELRSLVTLVSR
jgi:hypothetical protein